ncbi:hypothetical protein Q4Q35_18505 [Flavivirga aquimarina]|uniref:Uncharacterized protein n=1 Tax=Flavivirga aquimarina TaxID=2027862 RepID=A0ABT8WFG8_9FLAO|nr:hypothetical protein [Flavivirga aquimarina]MDO5971798.1 hypothetical protein [Flavivirga aquimarina]
MTYKPFLIEKNSSRLCLGTASRIVGFKKFFIGENLDGWYLKLRSENEALAKRVKI